MSGQYRFRPRFRGLPWVAGLVGVALCGWSVSGRAGSAETLFLALGAIGLVLAALSRLSPARRYVVCVDEKGLSVRSGNTVRFSLPWQDVQKVSHFPEEVALFVDGGAPQKSLLIPGAKTAASYDIEGARELIERVLREVAADRVEVLPGRP